MTPYIATDAPFSAVFPSAVQESHKTIKADGQSLTLLLYTSDADNEELALGYEAIPAGLSANLEGAINGEASAGGGHIVSTSTATYLGYPAEDAIITVGLGTFHVRVFATGSALYIVDDLSKSSDAPTPVYETFLATFNMT